MSAVENVRSQLSAWSTPATLMNTNEDEFRWNNLNTCEAAFKTSRKCISTHVEHTWHDIFNFTHNSYCSRMIFVESNRLSLKHLSCINNSNSQNNSFSIYVLPDSPVVKLNHSLCNFYWLFFLEDEIYIISSSWYCNKNTVEEFRSYVVNLQVLPGMLIIP